MVEMLRSQDEIDFAFLSTQGEMERKKEIYMIRCCYLYDSRARILAIVEILRSQDEIDFAFLSTQEEMERKKEIYMIRCCYLYNSRGPDSSYGGNTSITRRNGFCISVNTRRNGTKERDIYDSLLLS